MSENPVERAALLLLSLGPAEAAEVFMADLPAEGRSLFAVQRGGLRE